jgi:hypothetical protein
MSRKFSAASMTRYPPARSARTVTTVTAVGRLVPLAGLGVVATGPIIAG